MTIQPNRLVAIVASLLLALTLVLLILGRSAEASVTDYRFIALVGNLSDIDQTALPFESDGRIEFVRDYSADALNYYEESPLYPGAATTLPPQFTIKVYQVMTTTPNVNPIVADVQVEAANHANVHLEKDLRHLAYAPDIVLVSGPCGEVNSVANGINLFPVPGLEAVEMAVPAGCFAAGLFKNLPNRNVRQTVTEVNLYADQNGYENTYAQPNQFTMGFPGSDFIFGSPAGMAVSSTPLAPTLPSSPFDGAGEGIAVVVFDTSPYENAPDSSSQMVNNKLISVNHSIQLPSTLPITLQPVVGSHGTFVATPIVELAPLSDIFLVRTLNLSGIGDEFTLISAIDQMREYFLNQGDIYNGIIFNYSLGLEENNLEPRIALSRTLRIIHETNIVQVAASGNNSAWSLTPEDANLPASHPDVIGVTAIAPGNGIACYANKGDIATWGGGKPRSAPGDCLPDKMVHDCAAGISSACLHGYDPHSPSEWAYGVGTSFASPIIAGMLAQLMERLTPPRSETWIKPIDARVVIEANATRDDPDYGKGFIGDFGVPTSVELSNRDSSGTGYRLLITLTLLFIMTLAGIRSSFVQQTNSC